MKPPVWLRSAERSREKQLDYYAKLNPLAAINMDEEIDRIVDLLGANPQMGRKGRVAGTYELVMPGGVPFIVVYRIKAGTPEILRVLHQSQQWPPPAKAKPRSVTIAMK